MLGSVTGLGISLKHKHALLEEAAVFLEDDVTPEEVESVRRIQAHRSHDQVSFVDISSKAGSVGTQDTWTAVDPRSKAMALDMQNGWVCSRRGDAIPRSAESYSLHTNRCCVDSEPCADDRVIPPGGGHLEGKQEGDSKLIMVYVPIYKNANSLYRQFLLNNVDDYQESTATLAPTFFATSSVFSFTFVRHPIYRYISAYNTVVGRSEKIPVASRCWSAEWEDMFSKPEPERFRAITEFFVNNGYWVTSKARREECRNDKFIQANSSTKTLPYPETNHLYSQLWFLEAWPVDLKFIGRMEHMKEDFVTLMNLTVDHESRRQELVRKFESMSVSGSPPKKSISVDLALRQVRHIQMLHEYFTPDFQVFGYGALDGFHMSQSN